MRGRTGGNAQCTRHKAQGTRHKAQGSRARRGARAYCAPLRYLRTMRDADMNRSVVMLLLAFQALPAATQFTTQDSGVTTRLRGVSAVSAQAAWASGADSTVLRTTDGGANWRGCRARPSGSTSATSTLSMGGRPSSSASARGAHRASTRHGCRRQLGAPVQERRPGRVLRRDGVLGRRRMASPSATR